MKADEKFFKSSVAIIHRVFSDIYNLVLRKNANPKMVLREFQQAVAQVHKWTPSKQQVEFDKAIRFETKYEKLILMNMRSSVKAVIPSDRVKYAMEEIPDPVSFYHMCLVEVSRDMYRYPSLMYHNIDTFTRRKNRDQIKELIHAAIDKTLMDIVPVLSDSEPDEDEEQEIDEDVNSNDDVHVYTDNDTPLVPRSSPNARNSEELTHPELKSGGYKEDNTTHPEVFGRREFVNDIRQKRGGISDEVTLNSSDTDASESVPDCVIDTILPELSKYTPPETMLDSDTWAMTESKEQVHAGVTEHIQSEKPVEPNPRDGIYHEEPVEPDLPDILIPEEPVEPDLIKDLMPKEETCEGFSEVVVPPPNHIIIDIPDSVALKKKSRLLTSSNLSLVCQDRDTGAWETRYKKRLDTVSRMSYEPFSDSESEADISVTTADYSSEDDLLACDECVDTECITSEDDEL